MKVHLFSLPALAPDAAQEALNRHLASHRVSHIERHFIADGAASFWSVCVTSVDGTPEATTGEPQRRSRGIDYRDVLAADEFALYDRLRRWRKAAAEAEGLPPYAVFSNDQLAAMVQQRLTTAAGLATLDGVGDARLQRYAPQVLPLLAQGVPTLGPPPAPAPPQAAGPAGRPA